jgi:hypothetical protein
MIEQMYYGLLKSLNVKMDYSSDNLFRIRDESQVEQYIGRVNYLELKRIFNEKLRKKYIKKLEDLKFLDPVELLGDRCYYIEKDNLLGLSEVHYLISSVDYKLYTITKEKEDIIRARVPAVGEYDKLLKGLLENSEIYENEYYGVGIFNELYGFDVKDAKQEDLLRVISVQSVYKQYCCYVMIVENSEGKVKKLPLQNFIKLQ